MELETVLKAAGQGLGLCLFAWAIYREQVGIRKELARQTVLLTGIALANGVKVTGDL